MYDPGFQKQAVVDNTFTTVVQPMPVINEPQLKRTRRNLMILLGISIGISIFSILLNIIGVATAEKNRRNLNGTQVGFGVLLFLFYSFGFLAAKKYQRTGLRVFGWLSIISFIINIIVMILVITGVVLSLIKDKEAKPKHFILAVSILGTFAGIICIATLVVSVIIIRLTFKLAKFIDARKC